MVEIVTIESLGHRGDGIFRTSAGPVYVPYALPGERVAIEREGERARLIEVLEASPERVAPVCRHFGTCGGCALQMMPLAATRQMKRDLVIAALEREGVAADVAETIGVNPSSRRRAVMTALRSGGRIVLGFNERLSNRVVDIEECPVLSGRLAERLAGIRTLLASLVAGPRPVRVTILLTRAGIDLDVSGTPAPGPETIARIAALARGAQVARLSLGGIPVLTLAEPLIDLGGVPVGPPPGAFLQASAEAEAIMAGLVGSHLAGARKIVDLFCGLGTFALSLARGCRVTAVESNPAALDALGAAARSARGLKRIETERRDLSAHPLSPAELNAFDGAVFDPPRAGARTQAAALAASGVPRVAAVSCNPASFARDARLLIDGGYRLERVIPVDQFVYSAETEVVGLFARASLPWKRSPHPPLSS